MIIPQFLVQRYSLDPFSVVRVNIGNNDRAKGIKLPDKTLHQKLI